MKAKKSELDVDFIGGQGPMTKEEEKALSEFFKKRKLGSKKTAVSKVGGKPKTVVRQSAG